MGHNVTILFECVHRDSDGGSFHIPYHSKTQNREQYLLSYLVPDILRRETRQPRTEER